MKGILKVPNKNPIACDAAPGPTMSNAIGPSRHTKIPSHTPIIKLIAIRPPKLAEKGIHSVEIPRIANASCCILIRLTHSKSASFPKTIRLTPDVILRQRISQLPSSLGKVSSICFGWKDKDFFFNVRERPSQFTYPHLSWPGLDLSS